ncbi:MAG: homoserine dehydrogenase [Phycisphaerales bacterium]
MSRAHDLQHSRAQPLRVALLGCGTVGRELARRLLAGALDGGRSSPRVELVRVLVRRAELDRGLPPGLLTDRLDDVLDAEPDAVVEVMGGIEAPLDAGREVLSRGVPFVTANKSLLAHHGEELRSLAQARGAPLAFEAAVGASLPVVAVLRALRADRLLGFRGVLNGTCNFVLDRLSRASTGPGGARLTLDDAVREAQALGLAEPDPSADLSGRDAAEKLCVIAQELGWVDVRSSDVRTRGIERLTADDCAAERREGRAIRLIASIEFEGERPMFAVEPVALDARDPLAQLPGEENGVVLNCEMAGRVFLRGRGAGPGPTASALLGDLASALGLPRAPSPRLSGRPAPAREPRSTRHSVRLARPGVTPDDVFAALAAAGVGAERIELARDGVRVTTGPATRAAAGRLAADLDDDRTLVVPILASG